MLSGLEHQPSKPKAGQPKQLSRQRESVINIALIALAALLLLAIAGFVIYHSDLILPNVSTPGVETLGVVLGGKTRAKAVDALRAAWQSKTLTLRAGEHTWTVTALSLGLDIDAAAMAEQAHRRSRLLGQGRTSLSPVLDVDVQAVEAALKRLAPELYVAPQDAAVRLIDGRLEAVPAVTGLELDVSATSDWLIQSAHQVVVQGVLDLAIRSLPAAITDVSILVEQGNAWLSSLLLIRAYDPIEDEVWVWTVGPEAWIEWMTLTVNPNADSGVSWALNADKVTAFLQAQAETLGEMRYLGLENVVDDIQGAIENNTWAVNLHIYHTAQTHIVQFGETLSSISRFYGMPYPWLEQANPGVEALSPGQAVVIPSPDLMLPLPVVEGKRIMVSIGQQAMWAYENGAVKWVWPVSTGIASSPTAPGVFQIQSHDPNAYAASWDLWMPYFMGIYRPVPASSFMNGFHGFPTRGGTTLLWTGNLGAPVTYGCILLETGNAAALYEWAEEGVVVEIRE
ncbi:MAG: L,D-transpeptidase family protein [Anaerolineae bacterium]|nr:L,D-transpeptidase family protein [Anaerolineae bacterium]